MKNSNIFNTWIREFCSLVFIQTIQAFIFAIIISLIVSIMTPVGSTAVQRADLIGATGMIAVIALASISKIEELVKKIFKVQPGVADPSMRGGMKSLATTMMAAKLAGRVGDNVKKVAGGIGGAVSANNAIRQTKGRFARDMKQYNPNAQVGAASEAPKINPPSSGSGEQTQKTTSTEAGNKNSNLGAGTTGVDGNAAIGAPDVGQNPKAMKDYYAKLDAYQDKMKDLKKKRRDAIISIGSGLTETAGAAAFGTIGAVGGAAIGEGKEIIQGGLSGMGVGDAIGGAAMAPIRGANNAATEIAELHRTKQRFIDDVASTSAQARNNIESKRLNISKYHAAKTEFANFERDVFDVGDID